MFLTLPRLVAVALLGLDAANATFSVATAGTFLLYLRIADSGISANSYLQMTSKGQQPTLHGT